MRSQAYGIDAAQLLGVLRAFLGDGTPDYEPALRLCIDCASAKGGALAEWAGEALPRTLALTGPLRPGLDRPALVDFVRGALRESRDHAVVTTREIEGDPPLLCGVLRRPGVGALLGVLCDPPRPKGAAAALEVVLRLMDRRRSRPSDHGRRRVDNAWAPIDSPPGVVRCVSPAMRVVYRQVAEMGPLDCAVLVQGETGVGKEHVVRALHAASRRARRPFVAVNCAALPADLLEAEMFGVASGAATGVRERPGRFHEADGGTLFLDEIGELPIALQPKLLRALESGEVQPLGGRIARVDVRIVAATNADLRQRIAAGTFRADCFYRLAAVEIRVPPLRERSEDVPVLVRHLVHTLSAETGRAVAGLTINALDKLIAHAWPGNVRELAHEVRRFLLATPIGGAVEPGTLLPRAHGRGARSAADGPRSLRIDAHVAAIETDLLGQALAASGGNVAEAARLLGISRNGLLLKARRLGVDLRRPSYRR